VDHRRHAALVVCEEARLDPEHALLQRPVGPHLAVAVEPAVRAFDGYLLGQIQHPPEVPDPGPDGHDEVLAADRTPIRLDGAHSAVVGAKAGNPEPGMNPDALALCFGGQGPYGGFVVRVPPAVLVQDARDVLGPPVVEDAPHVAQAFLLAFHERRRILDRLLLLVDLHDVVVHHLG
jgi:hypothetical protein